MIRVAVLGSTGSIGRSALEVVSRHPERFQVTALVANTKSRELQDQVRRFRRLYFLPVGVGQATHVENKVRIPRRTVFVTKGNQLYGQDGSFSGNDTFENQFT